MAFQEFFVGPGGSDTNGGGPRRTSSGSPVYKPTTSLTAPATNKIQDSSTSDFATNASWQRTQYSNQWYTQIFAEVGTMFPQDILGKSLKRTGGSNLYQIRGVAGDGSHLWVIGDASGESPRTSVTIGNRWRDTSVGDFVCIKKGGTYKFAMVIGLTSSDGAGTENADQIVVSPAHGLSGTIDQVAVGGDFLTPEGAWTRLDSINAAFTNGWVDFMTQEQTSGPPRINILGRQTYTLSARWTLSRYLSWSAPGAARTLRFVYFTLSGYLEVPGDLEGGCDPADLPLLTVAATQLSVILLTGSEFVLRNLRVEHPGASGAIATASAITIQPANQTGGFQPYSFYNVHAAVGATTTTLVQTIQILTGSGPPAVQPTVIMIGCNLSRGVAPTGSAIVAVSATSPELTFFGCRLAGPYNFPETVDKYGFQGLPKSALVANCLLENCGIGATAKNGARFINNTFANCAKHIIAVGDTSTSLLGVRGLIALNNIVHGAQNSGTTAIQFLGATGLAASDWFYNQVMLPGVESNAFQDNYLNYDTSRMAPGGYFNLFLGDDEPLFADAAGGDYRIVTDSPVYQAGLATFGQNSEKYEGRTTPGAFQGGS